MVVFELGKIPLLLFGVNSTRLMVDSFCYKGTWLNRYDTDSPLWVLRMASARIMEMSITWRQERTRCHTNCKTLCSFKHQLSKNAHSNLTFFSSYVNFCSGNGFQFPDLYFGTMLHLLLLRDRIGDNHSFKTSIVDAGDRWARKDAMS